MTYGGCLPWRHPFLLLTSRLMLCFLQNDNSPHYKGKQLPEEGRSRGLIWGSVCNLSQIPGTSKGTTHLENGELRKLLKSPSEPTLFPELCLPGFLFIPLEFTKVPRHLGKKKSLNKYWVIWPNFCVFRHVATKLVNPRQTGCEIIAFSYDFIWC